MPGINENYKIKTLVSDIKKYKLDIVGLQETHMKGSGIVKVDKDYELFYSGSEDNKHHGIGMFVNRALKLQTQDVSAR